VRAQLAAWDPAAVVAVTGDHSALGRYLTSLLGPPAVSEGGVLGWRLDPPICNEKAGPYIDGE
jgi:hypothetical protein